MVTRRVTRVWVLSLLILFAGAGAGAAAAMQDPQAPPGFDKMTADDKSSMESLPAAPLVFSAYAAVWLVLLGYIFVLWRRASRLEAELRTLQRRGDR